jgi:predicted TPR repeat methyltransferase
LRPEVAEIRTLLRDGQAEAAAALAQRRCEQDPHDADAWYLQAAAFARLVRWADVIRCCARVLDIVPDRAEARYNMAVALAQLGRFAEATEAFARVIELDPGFTDARLGQATAEFELGRAAQEQGRTLDAMARFEAAIALNPKLVDALGHLGALAAYSGEWNKAIASFERLLELDPAHLSGLINYGGALKAVGRMADAAAVFRRALALHPESQPARYFVAAMEGDRVPAHAPRDYVRDLFDSYAPGFEHHLVDRLQYRMPDLIAGTLRDLLGDTPGRRSVLDLGCGTGLVGMAVRSFASRLVGIDLSERMIAAASSKGVYDELHVAEIGDYLARPGINFDVVVAADVFIYIGDMSGTMQRVAACLAPGGLFAFSVERTDGLEPYVLRSSGRYAQSEPYIRSLAARAGLEEVRAEAHVVRVEAGSPVPAMLFVFRAPP